MWYVMQVISGQESRTVLKLERIISGERLGSCFIPMRRLKKKYKGAWHEVTEKLFPGYVFLTTNEPQLLYEDLKMVPALTKMLGKCEEYFTPLSKGDTELLHRLKKWTDKAGGNDGSQKKRTKEETLDTGAGIMVGISKVKIDEGRQLRVLSGPLKDMEGEIKKVNLHKRIAVVEMEFMGSLRAVHLGIELVEE